MRNIIKVLVVSVLIGFSSCSKEYMPGYSYDQFNGTTVYELAMAARHNKIQRIESLMKDTSLNPNVQGGYFGNTVLMVSVLNRKNKVIETLLKNGADPNCRNKSQETPLIFELGHDRYDNNTKILELLIKYGADVNAVTYCYDTARHVFLNTTPLITASGKASLSKVDCLIKHGADPNKWVGDQRGGALTEALIQERMEIVKYLIFDAKVKIPPYCMVDIQGDSIGILKMLRRRVFDLDSKEYQIKMEVVRYLKTEYNLDYDKEPIPNDFTIQKIKKRYPNDWEVYITKY